MPAVPVRLGGREGPQLYASIDTGAKISAMSESTFQRIAAHIKTSSRLIEGVKGAETVEIASVPLVLCDPVFEPWIELGEVPFAIVKGTSAVEPASRIVLGFESCLATLRVDIDYPGNQLTLYGPASIQRRPGTSERVLFPTAIAEGETLFAMGSYRAAVMIVAAAVEEAIRAAVPQSGLVNNWTALVAEADRTFGLETDIKDQLEMMRRLRNVAVHGPSTTLVSRKEAEAVLSAAKSIITRTSKLKSAS
jgi:hypothetical protein